MVLLLLVLPLLTLPGTRGGRFLVKQAETLESEVGGSVTIPCFFTYPDTYRPWTITIIWRVHNFHGETIFHSLNNYTRGDYQGRIEFLGSPLREKTGAIRLHRLRKSDSNKYFCRVKIYGAMHEAWQSILGTKLTVRERSSVVPASPRRTWQPWMSGAAAGGGLLCLLVVAGVCFFMRRKPQTGAVIRPLDYTPDVPVAEVHSSEEIVYSVVRLSNRPGDARNIIGSEQHHLYAAVKFHTATN